MTQKFYKMKELPESERPYEKLEKSGVGALSDAELLAVLIKSGSKKRNSVEVATELLDLHPIYKGLLGLNYLSDRELKQVEGIGQVKAAQILCSVELSRRMARIRKPKMTRLDSPAAVAEYFMDEMRTKETEHSIVAYLDNRCHLLRHEMLFVGSASSCLANPREILKKALQYGATSFILIHNHPSGDPTPSEADILLSERLKEAGDLIGIALIDHIILGDCQYVSLKQRGCL